MAKIEPLAKQEHRWRKKKKKRWYVLSRVLIYAKQKWFFTTDDTERRSSFVSIGCEALKSFQRFWFLVHFRTLHSCFIWFGNFCVWSLRIRRNVKSQYYIRADLQPSDIVALSAERKSRVDTGIELFASLFLILLSSANMRTRRRSTWDTVK